MSVIGEQRRAEDSRSRTKHSALIEKARMEHRAAMRLRRSPYHEIRGVLCEYHEGLLRLRGRVHSYYMKQLAQTAVQDIDGVVEILNQLEVAAPPD